MCMRGRVYGFTLFALQEVVIGLHLFFFNSSYTFFSCLMYSHYDVMFAKYVVLVVIVFFFFFFFFS